MMEKPKLGLVHIDPFENDGKWYFELTYNVENADGDVVQIVFPSVRSPFTEKEPVGSICDRHNSMRTLRLTCDETIAYSFMSGYASSHRIIWKKPPEEMTLKEIEAALGHPVKIVSEKEE